MSKRQPNNRRFLWVVEMQINGDWQPTTGVELSRDEACTLLNDWRQRNPDDKFRVVEYVMYERH